MLKLKIFGLGFSILALFLVSLFLLVGLFKPKMAGLNISTTPVSRVLINNQEVGITPYKDFLKPGKYVLRLIPELSDQKVEAYDAEVTLEQGIETVIRREFSKTSEESSGYLITFEKISRNETSISVITDPDFSEVAIDGKSRAITPYKTSGVLPGEHEISVKQDDFLETIFKVNAVKGYHLLALVKLAKGSLDTQSVVSEVTPTQTPTPTLVEIKDKGMGFIEVINTPTGFLRVRSEPSTLGSEVGQAKPGEKYVLVGVDPKTGWYKIEFEPETHDKEAKSGWVSNQYAKKIES